MTETERTSLCCYAPAESAQTPAQSILRASPWALAHAVAAKLAMRDIIPHMLPQLRNKDIACYLPTYARAVAEKGLAEMDTFIGISKGGGWGQNVMDVRDLPVIEGFSPGEDSVDGQQQFMMQLQSRPVQHLSSHEKNERYCNVCNARASYPKAVLGKAEKPRFVGEG